MKILRISVAVFFAALISSCWHRRYDSVKDFDIKDFHPIPNSSREYLIDNIKSSTDYKYWECVFRDIDPFVTSNRGQVIVYNGDSLNYSKIAKKITSDSGFFVECHPGICFSYIIGIKSNSEIDLINTDEKLKTFVGEIDNLEEVILLSKINGYWFDIDTLIAGSYKIKDSNYLLYLLEYSTTPVTYKSVKAVITKSGDFRVLDKKIYKQTDEYIMF